MHTGLQITPPALRDSLANRLVEEIKLRHRTICANEDSFPILHDNIVRLERLIMAQDGASEAEEALAQLTTEERSSLNYAYCRWETEIENRFAQDIISGNELTFNNYQLSDRFHRLIQRELLLLPNPGPRRILFIGSGPLPISAYHLHAITGVPIDCLDQDDAATKTSRQAINRLGLQDSLRVIDGQGERFDIRNYDLIVVALLAKPKRRILRNLRRQMTPDSLVLCRTSAGLRSLVYEPTPDNALAGFRVLSCQMAEGDQTISTLLLRPTAQTAAIIKLRWLEEIDEASATGLLHLMNRILQTETTIGFPGPLDLATGTSLITQLNEDIKARRRHVLVATDNNTIVGQVIITPHHLPNCRHLIELSRGIIDPSYRGTGLALRAFQLIADKCEALNCEMLLLDVRAGTMAAAWWKSFGFSPFGVLPDYARVNGKRYQGLYMSQTVAALRQRLSQLANGKARVTSIPPSSSPADVLSFMPYCPRRLMRLPLLAHADWRLKFYGITIKGEELNPLFIEAAENAVRQVLPCPAVAPPQRYGVGFVVAHAGRDSDFVLVCWWRFENELVMKVFTSPPGQPEKLVQRLSTDESIGCVWDLNVLWRERNAWIDHVLRSGAADFDGYLAAAIESEV